MRKHKWLQKDKIIYPHISDDLSDILNTLVDAGFLMDGWFLQIFYFIFVSVKCIHLFILNIIHVTPGRLSIKVYVCEIQV